MGYFTKNAYTTLNFFKWNERRVMRVWLTVFVLGMVTTYAFSQGTIFQLRQPEIAQDSADKFRDWRSMFEFSLAFFFLPLLVLSNLYSLTTRRVNFVLYLFTFLYAAIFSYKNLQNMSELLFNWEKHFGILKDSLELSNTSFWVHIFAYAFICIFNSVLIWWGLKK